MSFGAALAIWFLFVSLTLFVVLPFGVKTQHEAGETPVPGSEPSSPANPMLWRKLGWTLVLGTLLFGLYYANYEQGWIGLEDIPGWSKRGPQTH
jgi:predicted secreted protein